MKIEVKSTATTQRSGTAKLSGKPYSFEEQEAWVSVAGEYRRLRFSLRDGVQPYPVGEYELAESSYQVNNFGGLEINRVELVSVSASVRKVG